MRLLDVWNGRPAWEALAELKKPPKLAYRLMKYLRKLNTELAACEEGRQSCVHLVAGTTPPAIVLLSPDTPEFQVFLGKFNEFLLDESDLEPVGISMDDLIDALDAQTGNLLTERQLLLLEPFFTAKAPVLELVKA